MSESDQNPEGVICRPCPNCSKPNCLSKEEAKVSSFICPECYEQVSSAFSEGMAQTYTSKDS